MSDTSCLVSILNLILNFLCQVLWVWFTKKQPDTPCNDHKKIWIGQLKTKEQQDPFWKKIIFIFCLMRISHILPLQSVTYHNEFKSFLKEHVTFCGPPTSPSQLRLLSSREDTKHKLYQVYLFQYLGLIVWFELILEKMIRNLSRSNRWLGQN